MRILVVDNYDSFVYNLVQYLGQLGLECTVLRNDHPDLADPVAVARDYDAVLVSPGPSNPDHAGQSLAIIDACAAARTPMLGVCLGHQALGQAMGGQVVRADELLHGKTSVIHHQGEGILAGMPNPFTVTRYHSLTVSPDNFPPELEILARTDSGMIMAMQHRELPLYGVQFHPESIMTEGGHRLLANWLTAAGWEPDAALLKTLEDDHAKVLAGVNGGTDA